MRHVTGQGLSLIKRFEGFSATPYLCPAGVWTVGYGHVVGKDNHFRTISESKAEILLRDDIEQAEYAVQRLICVSLTEGQFDALVSFTFNLGAGALQRSALRRKVNRQEHNDVPTEFMKWVWAAGRRLPGLVRRRSAEAALYTI